MPDVTVGGWTLTQDQWTAVAAVLVGAAAMVLLMSVLRHARRWVLATVITLTMAALWARFGR